jgi:hypothetical protein
MTTPAEMMALAFILLPLLDDLFEFDEGGGCRPVYIHITNNALN